MLSPPTIVEPVTPCMSQIRVRGQLPDSTVTVLDDRQNVVAVGTMRETEDLLRLAPGGALRAGERLWAQQETVDDKSEVSPEPVTVLREPSATDLETLYSPVPLLQCGRCVWLNGAYPGATVSLVVGNEPPVSVEATASWAKVALDKQAPGFDPGTPIFASQSACGLQGGPVRLPNALALRAADLTEHALSIDPPVRCQRAIKLTGVLPGAQLTIERSKPPSQPARTFTTCFALPEGWFWFDTELLAGEKIVVRQGFPLCETAEGPVGQAASATVADTVPSPPGIEGPICRGDRIVTVTGTIAGAILEFLADGDPLCRAGAVGGKQQVAMPKLVGIARLTVRQTACRGGGVIASGDSNAVRIRAPAPPSGSPSIVEPLFAGGVAVGVANIAKGATARIISTNHGGQIGEARANGEEVMDVPLELPLAQGDLIRLDVLSCGKTGSIVPFSRVNPRPDLPPPALDDPSDDFGGVVLVREAIPGAVVDVAAQGASGLLVPVGSVAGTAKQASVPIQPLLPGRRLSARQRMPGEVSLDSQFAELQPKGPVYDARPDHATFRVSQLVGDSDPTGRPHPVNTGPLGVNGTDLGFPVEHKGALWLFFGDSGGTDKTEKDADPIAWVEAEDPDEGPILHFVLDPSTGEFRRLTVPELGPLGNFETATGGFSYDGSLYLFVTKTKTENLPLGHARSRANRSYLVVGDDPSQDFHHLYDISSSIPGEEWPAGPWLIMTAPVVVNNADWPDIPAASGTGLLIYAVGPCEDFDRGAVRLAWTPLSPGQRPVPPSDWLFLSDTMPRWQRLADLATANKQGDKNARPTELVKDDPEHLGYVSVQWSDTLRRWVMMYLTGIVRTARLPTGPWSPPQTVFKDNDPTRNADCKEGSWCNFTYAPSFIGRWTRFDRSSRTATIYYNLSVVNYYKVMLMRSQLRGV